MNPLLPVLTFQLLVGGLLFCGSPIASAGEAGQRPPNVLLFLADDLGVETIGCYGGTSYETPRLDRLATTGIRFEHCYSMPVCHPTRICFLTGRYPFHVGNPEWGSFPKEAESHTLAQVLKSAGYATAVAGKWQVAMLGEDLQQPCRMGFDSYSLFGWHEGPRYYQPLIWENGARREGVENRFGPDVYCEFLIDFMEENKDRPFWAYYPMTLCHSVSNDFPEPVPFGPHGRYDTYEEMVEKMDERVGRVLDAIDRLGLADNTLVLFTADNGTPKSIITGAKDGELIYTPVSSMAGGRDIPGGKGEMTDGGTHVPLIARWPGRIQTGQTTEALVDFADFLPTFADVAGAAPPAGVELDGESFAPCLFDADEEGREWVFCERNKRYWVRDQHWKLYNDGPFYDMRQDPAEKKPLADSGLSGAAQAAKEKLIGAFEKVGVGYRS